MAAITRDDVSSLIFHELGTAQRQRLVLLGAGGGGSNVTRLLCRRSFRRRFSLVVYDHDIVELHNLNRTSMYQFNAVKWHTVKKVDALLDGIVRFSRNELRARSIANNVNSHSDVARGIIIDCRDTISPDMMIPDTWIKLGYDGGSNISFTWKPAAVAAKVLSLNAGGNSYEVVPSFYVPAGILSVMTLRFLQFACFRKIKETKASTVHFEIDELIDDIAYQWLPTGELK